MKISIVTVTYNCQHLIKKTIQSVIEQSCQSIEYIIIDGGSTDQTYSIILQYAQGNNIIRSISEPDTGIYNAMNKAVKYITGDYVLFLNAGDYFYSKDTLEKFVNNILKFDRPDIVYGNSVNYVDNRILSIESEQFDWKSIMRAHGVCHQRVLAKTILLKEYQFDESYIYCADRDWFYYMYFKRKKFVYVNEDVVYYEATGFSSRKEAQNTITEETFQIQKRYFKYFYYINQIRIWAIKARNLLLRGH